MLDNLRAMAVFASVVENGSFSGCAKQLGITTSAVSQQIRSLEKDLGVVLLHRSTRKISLTEAGDSFFQSCREIVSIANQSKIELDSLKDELIGSIRFVTTPELAVSYVMPALQDWLHEHQELKVHFEAGDSDSDLIDKRIDIALLMRQQPAESMFDSECLCEVEQMLVASPDYLSRHNPIAKPSDLASHSLIGINHIKSAQTLELCKNGTNKLKIKMRSRLVTNDVLILKSMALRGFGIARALSLDVQHELAKGSLVQILPNWRLPTYYLFAITLKREQQPQKVSQCLAMLRAYFDKKLGRLTT